ncbi:hypothetical protein BDR05DRAFT_989777 [Suillus weaverae]|nr:hypothetical protein BDR05DRAFT_989777 [Suillus weaverae]
MFQLPSSTSFTTSMLTCSTELDITKFQGGIHSNWLEALGDLACYCMATAAMVTNNQLKGLALTTDAVSKAVVDMEPEKRLGKSSPCFPHLCHLLSSPLLILPPLALEHLLLVMNLHYGYFFSPSKSPENTKKWSGWGEEKVGKEGCVVQETREKGEGLGNYLSSLSSTYYQKREVTLIPKSILIRLGKGHLLVHSKIASINGFGASMTMEAAGDIVFS